MRVQNYANNQHLWDYFISLNPTPQNMVNINKISHQTVRSSQVSNINFLYMFTWKKSGLNLFYIISSVLQPHSYLTESRSLLSHYKNFQACKPGIVIVTFRYYK
jgi:hypothetical protein